MSCKLNRTGAALNNTDAAESICPKGWKLPAQTDVGSFQNLYNQYPNSATAGWVTGKTIPYNGGTKADYSGLKLGRDSDDAIFPAAGQIYASNGLVDASSYGYYWSRKAYWDTDGAYYLSFGSGAVNPQFGSSRYVGYSVRCIADPAVTESDFTYGDIEWSEEKDTNVNVNVPSILTIDAVSGLAETADASKIIEGTATATISSNTKYNVTLHSTQPSLKDPTVTTTEISPVSSSNPVQPGNNAWGFWNGTSDPKSYTLSITTNPQSFPNTTTATTNTTGDPATLHTYYVGISISPSLPSGTYATDVIITASTK